MEFDVYTGTHRRCQHDIHWLKMLLRRRGVTVGNKIKVTFTKTMYYDPIHDEDTKGFTIEQIAELDSHLFVDHQISWDDLFDRSDVIFEAVHNDEDD